MLVDSLTRPRFVPVNGELHINIPWLFIPDLQTALLVTVALVPTLMDVPATYPRLLAS